MKDLFERTEFLLNGGVLTLLSDSLAAHAARGVILRPEGEDLTVLEAFGAGVESLFLKGRARDIQNAFPSPFLREAYDVAAAPLPGEWPWGIRLRGRDWVFFILLSEEPPKELIDHMPSFAGLLSLWQKHQKTAGTEERLSKLAYMVLATKSTLASVFEPMGLDYFGAFLCDVLTESLFPSRLSVVLDKGGRLSHLDGEDIQMPPRKGIFARDILSPVPVRLEESMRDSIGEAVFHDLAGEWSAILPIIGGDVRLFCLLRWETLPGEEALNFMELLGNVASKALSMSAMREEKERNMQELSRRAFLLNALHEAALKFLEQTSKEELLLQILDIFSEMTQAPRAVLVAWQPHAGGYVVFASKEDGILQRTGRPAGFPIGILEGDRPSSFTMEEGKRLFAFMEVPFLASLDAMEGIKMIFPLWDGDRLIAFIAVSEPLPGTVTMDLETLEILARTASAAMLSREWESARLASGKYLNVAALVHWESERIREEIVAEGGTPMLVKGPFGVSVSAEQERLCRLVVRMEDATVCVAEEPSEALASFFPSAAGWTIQKFPAGQK